MSKTANIERRLDALQRIASKNKTAKLTITRTDGAKIVMGAVEAIEYCRNCRMSVKSVYADVPNYAGLAAALGLCCNPVPDRSIYDFE